MTETEAEDEILGMLWTAWQAEAAEAADLAAAPALLYDDQIEQPTSDVAFGRATVRHTTGRQASLSGAGATRRYEEIGLVVVQCYGPLSDRGKAVARGLARVAKKAFEGRTSPSGSIWFRNCRTTEIGVDRGWYQINALAEFTYDDIS